MDDREKTISENADRNGEAEGRPEGSHDDHWRRAEEQYVSGEPVETGKTSEENWKIEAGLADDKPHPEIAPTVITPD